MGTARTNRGGFSLVELAISITIIGIFLSSALLIYKEFVDWNRKQKIKEDLNEIVSRISGYAVETGYLPDSRKYEKLFSKRDPYGQKYVYVFSPVLTEDFLGKKGVNFCNISFSSLNLKAKDYFVDNVAFIVFSKGKDHKSDTKCGEKVLDSTSPCNGTVFTSFYADSVSWITLEKLKLKYGCPSGIKLLPQVLPTGKQGESYTASILIDGGLPPYRVNVKGKLPPGINYGVDKNKITLSGKPERGGTFYFSVCVEDSNVKPERACKMYVLVVNY